MTWDLTSYFPEFNGPEMLQFKEALCRDVGILQQSAAALAPLQDANPDAWEGILLRHEDLLRRMSHLGSYVGCLASADARNEAYLKEEAALARLRAEIAKVKIELLRAVKETTEECFSAFLARTSLSGAQNYLNRLREEARRAMVRDKEVLATDLGVDGIQAWGRFYDTMASKLEFDMVYPDGRRERLPMSQRRSLMDHPDRGVRKAAFDGGNAAWQTMEDAAAAALNAIAGTRLTLNRHRGVEHFLDIALFQAAISRKTLDAMLEALRADIEIPRRILRLKAKQMGRAAVAWYDLGAPLNLPNQEKLSWQKAKAMVGESFNRAYPALGNFFRRQVIEKNWVDWEPRAGKRPGGFCASSMLSKESRIFMTFNESLGDVLTLAHESGHAFHGQLMRDVRPYARGYPMTLAETASTFGEQVLMNGSLDDPAMSDAQKAMMLDVEIGHGAVYLLDIPVRYEFEKAFYEERKTGELSISRLKELMVATQRQVVGDLLEPGGEDAYFWASKLHFYITGITFYNFPYTFGYLLSRGLYAMFREEGDGFVPKYEEFLRLAGSDTAENVVRRTIGRELEAPEFWREAIESLEEPLKRLEALLPRVLPSKTP
ncbi:MAG: M3 family oligoendopeptidase [Deltaproteobacteria bacterium]|nr:M3 family oligoendopeptidase [Deltaproteobacteria bacterium]MBI2182982.1 M3 family oligoendopeptidase [Deltaproteobacteria bacterium]